jgi:hypothetical protein
MIQYSQVPLVEATPHSDGQRESSSHFHAIGTSVIKRPVDPAPLTYAAPPRQPVQSAGDPHHAISEHAPHSAPMQGLFPTHPPPLVHHQSTSFPFEGAVPSTSLQSSMDILPNPPATLSPFTPDPPRGAVVPPSLASGFIPAHQYGKVPSTGFPIPSSVLFASYPPYGYSMPFPPIPPGAPGAPMINSNAGGPSQMPMMYPPMMSYYYPPGYGQQPPRPLQ